MRKHLVSLLLAVLLVGFVHAQVTDTAAGNQSEDHAPFYGDHVWVRFSFEIGMTNIRPVATNQALFGSGGFDQVMTLGASESISFEPLLRNNLFGHDMSFAMHWYLAEKKTVSVSGKQYKYKLDGWEVMTSVIGFDAFANRNADLIVGGGFLGGNLKLYQTNITDSTEARVYKNPFVAPMARAEFRLNFGMITLGGRFTYRYDITNDIWQRKSEGLNPIPGYRFRETQFIIYVGLRGPFV